ncbi:hypothetical protein ACET9R_12515 [Aeromonas veronii]
MHCTYDKTLDSLNYSEHYLDDSVWLAAINLTPYYISFGKLELKAGGNHHTR